MKTKTNLLIVAVLLNCGFAHGQLLLGTGQVYTHGFDSLPLVFSIPAPIGAKDPAIYTTQSIPAPLLSIAPSGANLLLS